MKVLKLTIWFIFLTITVFGQNGKKKNQNLINPDAKRLNDSAVFLINSGNDEDYQKAILLLDQATKIDSNYFIAYWNKLAYNSQLRQFDKAIKAAKEMLRLKPNSPDYYGTIGGLYYRSGDSIMAKRFFEDGLILYDKILDTMNIKNKHYELLSINKAAILILSGNQTKGNQILKKLYSDETNPTYKEIIEMFMNKSRQEIMDYYSKTEK